MSNDELPPASTSDALTGPRAGDKNSRVRREGIAIVMAVDVSGSMRALDLSEKNQELTRLDAVKRVFEQFVLGSKNLGGRPDDAIGLVAFARYADTRSPLTLDHGNLVNAARALDFAREDEDGTAIGAGRAGHSRSWASRHQLLPSPAGWAMPWLTCQR